MADTYLPLDPTTTDPASLPFQADPTASAAMVRYHSPAEDVQRYERQKQADKLLCDLARKRQQQAEEAESEWREQAQQCLRYKAGEQWESLELQIRQQNPDNPRPALTINQLGRFTRQITNAEQQNRPGGKVRPVGSGSDLDTAGVFEGLMRAIFQASDWDTVYDTAFQAAVDHGKGYLRIVTDYESPWSFNQVLRLERVLNPFAVYLDPGGRTHPDYSTATWGMVVERLNKDYLCQRYEIPNRDWVQWTSQGNSWVSRDDGLLVDYYYQELMQVHLVQLRNGETRYIPILEQPDELDEDEQAQQAALVKGLAWEMLRYGVVPMTDDLQGQVERERRSAFPLMRACKLVGEVVVERSMWPSKYIPIVPILGDELDLNGRVNYRGIIYDMIDAQRAYNYWTALDCTTPLPTPTGWTTMGAVQVGDELFDEQGQPCTVLGKSPVHTENVCYRLTFDDGSSIIADQGHLWTVEACVYRSPGQRTWQMQTRRTDELSIVDHFIHVTKPLELSKQELPLHPYALGVWLGDGRSASARLTLGMQDAAAIHEELQQCGIAVGAIRPHGDTHYVTMHGTIEALRALDLIEHKHIPHDYLRASIAQRLALLQGLMDTDGSIDAKGQCSFTTTRHALRSGFAELLRSLGIKAVCLFRTRAPQVFPHRKTYPHAPFWQFSFSVQEGLPVFRLPRKALRQQCKTAFHWRRTKRHRLVSIERVPSVAVQCITVSSPSHLYLAGEAMIPTHNSAAAETVALAPKAPFIGTAKQFANHREWDTANTMNWARLPYTPDFAPNGQMVPPPQRQTAEPAIQAISVARQQAQQDLYNTSGLTPADLGEPSNEKSGRHAEIRRNESELGSSHYKRNGRYAVRHVMRILIDAIPRIYREPDRVLRILGKDDTERQVMLHPDPRQREAELQQQRQEIEGIYNLSVGTYDVVADTGANYQTQRQEAALNLIEVADKIPQVGQVLPDLILGNLDFDQAKEAARRAKLIIPAGILQENEGQKPEELLPIMTQRLQKSQQDAQALDAHAQELTQTLQAVAQENQQLKQDRMVQLREVQLKEREVALQEQEAVLKARAEAARLELEREKLTLGRRQDAHQAVTQVAGLMRQLTQMRAQLAALEAEEGSGGER